MYDTQAEGGLIEALRCAGSKSAIQHLKDNPIKASWADATSELLQQYEDAIQVNLPNRQVRRSG